MNSRRFFLKQSLAAVTLLAGAGTLSRALADLSKSAVSKTGTLLKGWVEYK